MENCTLFCELSVTISDEQQEVIFNEDSFICQGLNH